MLDDGRGLISSRRTESVTARVNHPPVALAGPDRHICPGDPVAFDGSASSDRDGGILRHLWRLSDGAAAEGARVERRFEAPGSVTATLAVTDDSGSACAMAAAAASVRVNAAPVVNAGPDREVFTGAAHAAVAFAAISSDPDGDGLTLTWEFGDGTSASGAAVTHRYAAAGTYTVTPTARDVTVLSCGIARDSATIRVTARD